MDKLASKNNILKNLVFIAEIDEGNGGLKSLSLQADPDRMNWVEGTMTWGLMQSLTGFDNYSPIPFKRLTIEQDCAVSVYEDVDTVLTVTRKMSDKVFHEEYTLTNHRDTVLFYNRGDLGIYTTFNDSYTDAETCMKHRCHAHIWCGGQVSYIRALKMGFSENNVGLVLRKGALDGYSVERLAAESSNDRGDFILHPSPVVLEPGESMTIAWDIFMYPEDDFEKTVLTRNPEAIMISARHDTVFIGETFELRAQVASEIESVEVFCEGHAIPYRLEGRTISVSMMPEKTGLHTFRFTVNGIATVARYYCVRKFSEILQQRIRFIIRNQQYHQPGSALDGAYLIYDNEDRRCYFQKYIVDHNACRERIGMGLLMARYLQHHDDPEVRASLEKFESFVRREFFDEDTGEVYNTIGKEPQHLRLYNAPWMISFWVEIFRLKKDPIYLDFTCKTMEYYYRNGGSHFYPNGSTFIESISVLRENGYEKEAEHLLERCREHIDNIVRKSTNYPKHEVRFEQTIVSPAVAITAQYYQFDPVPQILQDITKHVKILERFNGRQPDHRLNEIPIRHWDDYWFGKAQLFGDTFPHYWSVLSARAFMMYYEISGDVEYRTRAERCFRNTLCLFADDGTASCAYVYPYSIRMIGADGKYGARVRGEFNDAWSNDQDFALYFILRCANYLYE